LEKTIEEIQTILSFTYLLALAWVLSHVQPVVVWTSCVLLALGAVSWKRYKTLCQEEVHQRVLDRTLFLRYPEHVVPHYATGTYLATLPDVPGCWACGTTPESAYDALEGTFFSWMDKEGYAPKPVDLPSLWEVA
jgi:predicted RNase H-like HicB family nuclease